MTNPALLVHPPLGLMELRLSAEYEIVHLPSARADVRAALVLGSVGLTNETIDALPALRCIVCLGIGVDGVDLDYCRRRNIAVTNGRNINHEDVADIAIGLMIVRARRISEGERVLREGKWAPPLPVQPPKRLRGGKLGIVGMGAIGQAIARRAAAFGLEIKWFGPRAKPDVAFAYEPDLMTLAAWADIMIVAARGDQTGLIDAEVISALGPEGLLINISRGHVVDEDALIAALKSGALGGAGLDVFYEEPTPPARWADVPNTTLTPHLGGVSRESVWETSQNALENLRRFYAGEDLLTPLE